MHKPANKVDLFYLQFCELWMGFFIAVLYYYLFAVYLMTVNSSDDAVLGN